MRDFFTFVTFLLMLFSPCLVAARTMLTWESMDRAYLRFEASVATQLGFFVAPVQGNLCIQPFRPARQAPADSPAIVHLPRTQMVPPAFAIAA
jgi:hypothetical protein